MADIRDRVTDAVGGAVGGADAYRRKVGPVWTTAYRNYRIFFLAGAVMLACAVLVVFLAAVVDEKTAAYIVVSRLLDYLGAGAAAVALFALVRPDAIPWNTTVGAVGAVGSADVTPGRG